MLRPLNNQNVNPSFVYLKQKNKNKNYYCKTIINANKSRDKYI